LFAQHKLDSLDLPCISFASAFGDSNDEHINLEDVLPNIPDQGPASLDHPAFDPSHECIGIVLVFIDTRGFAAFEWETILHGNAGDLGDYKELAVLPDKIARYMYGYHAGDYAAHRLPPLLVDRSNTDVHGILKPHQVVYLC
jgi:hypothetical protein